MTAVARKGCCRDPTLSADSFSGNLRWTLSVDSLSEKTRVMIIFRVSPTLLLARLKNENHNHLRILLLPSFA